MKNKSLIERIRRLMAMAADGSSPNEAAIAARRARSLMDKHQVAVEDLIESDSFKVVGVGKPRKFTPVWEQALAIWIARYNDCIATFEFDEDLNNIIVFKGFKSDVTVAKFMFYYLMENGKRLCSRYMKEQGYTRYNAAIGTTFKDAYAAEVCAKLKEMIKARKIEVKSADGQSLVVVKQELVEQRFGMAKYGDRSRYIDGSIEQNYAKAAGRQAGKSTSIHTGLDNNNHTKLP